MSGRTRASSSATVCCSEKSQYASMPAFSTTLRSCISPHLPREAGLRRAVTSVEVCVRQVRGRRLQLVGSAQELVDLLAQAPRIALARRLQIGDQPVELAELLRYRRDELADAFAGAQRRASRSSFFARSKSASIAFSPECCVCSSVARSPAFSARAASHPIAAPITPPKRKSATATAVRLAIDSFFWPGERAGPRFAGSRKELTER